MVGYGKPPPTLPLQVRPPLQSSPSSSLANSPLLPSHSSSSWSNFTSYGYPLFGNEMPAVQNHTSELGLTLSSPQGSVATKVFPPVSDEPRRVERSSGEASSSGGGGPDMRTPLWLHVPLTLAIVALGLCTFQPRFITNYDYFIYLAIVTL